MGTGAFPATTIVCALGAYYTIINAHFTIKFEDMDAGSNSLALVERCLRGLARQELHEVPLVILLNICIPPYYLSCGKNDQIPTISQDLKYRFTRIEISTYDVGIIVLPSG